jgi:hypothetical protein
VTAYERQVERAESGACPLYRPKGYMAEERRRKKETGKMSWYRPYDTVLFCPPTPGSELAKRLRRVCEAEAEHTGLKVKVVERAGTKLWHRVPGLQVEQECEEEKCFLHQTGGKGNCRKEGAVYRGQCVTCLERGPKTRPVEVDGETVVEELEERTVGTTASYTGETGFGLLVRGGQHLEALAVPGRHPDNAFAKHTAEYHRGEEEEVKFQMELVGHFDKPLVRQVTEGCEIHADRSDIVMNSKLDHHLPAVSRAVFSQSAAVRGGGGSRGSRGRGRGRGRGRSRGGRTPGE